MEGDGASRGHLEPHMATNTCAFCGKTGLNMACCSACMDATYCSKLCQRTHWKEHKTNCRHAQVVNSKILAPGLFREWLKRAKIVALRMAFCRGMLEAKERNSAVLLDVGFDYNLVKFLPTGPSKTVPLSSLLQSDFGPQIREKMLQVQTTGKSLEALVITYDGSNFISWYSMSKEFYEGLKESMDLDWETIERGFEQVRVSVPSSSNWGILLERNMNHQMNAVGSSSSFCLFLLGALRAGSSKDRRKTHAVVVHYEASQNLGEIASLISFQVLGLTEAWTLYSESCIAQEEDKAEYFDLENSPRLQRHRQKDPRMEMMLMLFVYPKRKASFVYPVFGAISAGQQGMKVNVKDCDEAAATHFCVLQHTCLPKVTNPPLE